MTGLLEFRGGPCSRCKQPLPADFTIIAMKLHVCHCGQETEVNAREVEEYIGTLLAEIQRLNALVKGQSPFAGIDL